MEVTAQLIPAQKWMSFTSKKRGELSKNVEKFAPILTPQFEPMIFIVGSINEVPVWWKNSCFDNIISTSAQKVKRKAIRPPKYIHVRWQYSSILCYCRCLPFEEQRWECFVEWTAQRTRLFITLNSQSECKHTPFSRNIFTLLKFVMLTFPGHEFLFHPSNFVAQ